MIEPERRWSRWLIAACLAALALLMSLVEVGQVYLRSTIGGPPVRWVEQTLNGLPFWLLLAALTPLPAVFARRWPLDRAPRGKALAMHLVGVAVFVLGHALAVACINALRFGLRFPFASGFTKVLSFSSIVDLLIYAVIVGVTDALRFQSESRDRERQAASLRASLADARLAGLRAQVNPHMLFNTLNAVSVLAMKGEHTAVVRVLGLLSDLLRACLDETRGHEAALADELRLVESYLEIQRIRFADRLNVALDIAADTPEARVPTMVLQPLVENAVTHGLASHAGPGSIAIHAHRDGGRLELRIEDSGPGFGSSPHRGGGVGLSTVRSRLELLYGDQQQLTIGTSPLGGAAVTVSLPYRTR
jgi:two-component system, LytTR family, sensor kinase